MNYSKEVESLKEIIQLLKEQGDKAETFYEKKLKKQKQKLQQLIDELGHMPSEKGTPYSTYQEGWLDAMALAIKKFNELLNERRG